VILALIQSYDQNSLMKMKDSWVLSTVHHLEEAFRKEYPINNTAKGDIGLTLGRYPGDVYDGGTNHGAHPWFISTLGMAEYYYRLAQELKGSQLKADSLNIEWMKKSLNLPNIKEGEEIAFSDSEIKKIINIGDSYMKRAKLHVTKYFEMSEQFNRYDGYQTSAKHLSWSYAAYLTALKAKNSLQ
jgi:glucoamylase